MGDNRQEYLRKKAFYQSWNELINEDDTHLPDLGRRASENALRNAQRKSDARLNPVDTPIREMSCGGGPTNSSFHRDSTNIRRDPVVPSVTAVRWKVDMVESVERKTPDVANNRKRKRGSTIPSIPQDQQLFKQLVFYFFPNNNIAPARRMRIKKAVEYGAQWQTEWGDNITHAILDKAMTLDHLLKFVKLSRMPDRVIVVHENYPSECIIYRTLLNPRLCQFIPKGYRLTAATNDVQQHATSTSPSDLQIKGPKNRTVDSQSGSTADQIVQHHLSTSDQVAGPVKHIEQTGLHNYDSSAETTGEFAEALRMAKVLQNVPLDDDEDGSSTYSHNDGLQSEIDEDYPTPAVQTKKKPRLKLALETFQCMQKHSRNMPKSSNHGTINLLQQMANYYTTIGDEWRTRAYRKAISSLRNHPTKVITKQDALKLPNIGERLATKVAEIAYTDRLQCLEHAQANSHDQTLNHFMHIYGVGFVQASRWVQEGHRTLNDLLQHATLTSNQRIGIDHYHDFNSRIPRVEVAQHAAVVRNALQALDPSFTLIIGGSYRRGALTSGDIDCIITHPNANAARLRRAVFAQVVPPLFQSGFLVAALAGSDHSKNGDNDSNEGESGGGHGSKWHGASVLPGSSVWRRIDLLLVPAEELGAALIYFTGNDVFNRSIRLLARKKAMRLNQRGLFRDDAPRGKDMMRVGGTGVLIESKDEKRIFEILGVPWRPPEHREC